MKRAMAWALSGLLLVAGYSHAQNTQPVASLPASQVKADFLRVIDRPRVALDVRNHEVKTPDRGLIAERLDFASEARPDGSIERVPVLVVRPEGATGRLPAVLALHGTGGKKEGMRGWLDDLARLGFVAVAIDGRFHGERAGGPVPTLAYNQAIYQAYRAKPGESQAHPFYYDTCWDVSRTIDYLATRDDVDADRVGLTGTSKGGIEAWLIAAADDRIKVVVPAIAIQSFRWGLDHDRWQARANTIRLAHERVAGELGQPKVNREVCLALWNKVLPGILDEFDGPSMVRLLAGRPTLILNGELDPNCPIEGAEVTFGAARAAFHDAGADDKLKIMVAKGVGHAVTPEQHRAALDWFKLWLKPTPPPNAGP